MTRKGLKENEKKSGYFWELTNRLIKNAAKSQDYLFTFQTQSNFDGKIGPFPHFIYTDHTHLVNLEYPEYLEENLNVKSWQRKEKDFYKRSQGIFTMSNHVKNSLLNQYQIDPKKVKCVFAGANITQTDIIYPLGRYQRKKILFVGVDWERKGGPELIEAFKLVLKAHPEAQLDIVGCNPKIDVPNVKIWGKLPIKEVKKIYESASIFCMPSKREPFGIVYLEAMAYKLPIVALKIGALPDFVEEGKTGFLVNHREIKIMADRLIQLLDQPTLAKEMGETSYKKVKEQYTWENSVSEIKKFIDSLNIFKQTDYL
ncbi:glycosyltransferase family 4 protein [Aquiflexum gelatinilyticum]|uniref:Glycosyltransferase family 4 protein n=1 Tax=Aquiflexum gelatinilyticum TaxID=2961943 RepID=A0A9X2T1G5_9BACT|nr:glycosyltransferase family 4 protein [Aquiflexum gelatinilyticum]MCR9014615.1 glycosyltransferase family 4 protein [Aquiflexum gelatinilyticum]